MLFSEEKGSDLVLLFLSLALLLLQVLSKTATLEILQLPVMTNLFLIFVFSENFCHVLLLLVNPLVTVYFSLCHNFTVWQNENTVKHNKLQTPFYILQQTLQDQICRVLSTNLEQS